LELRELPARPVGWPFGFFPGHGDTPAGSGRAVGPALGDSLGVALGMRLAVEVAPEIGPLPDGRGVESQPANAGRSTAISVTAARRGGASLIVSTAAL
jgi:hypothetical protein